MILMGPFQLEMFHDVLLCQYRFLRTIGGGGKIRHTWDISEDYVTGGCKGLTAEIFSNNSKKENTLYKTFIHPIIFIMQPFTWA